MAFGVIIMLFIDRFSHLLGGIS